MPGFLELNARPAASSFTSLSCVGLVVLVEGSSPPVLLPMRVRSSVPPPGTFQSVQEYRSLQTEIAKGLHRKARRNIPARAERGFRTLERLGMPAAKTGVRGHDSSSDVPVESGTGAGRSALDYAGALGRVKAPLADARRCAALTPPSARPRFCNYRSDALSRSISRWRRKRQPVKTGRPGSAFRGLDQPAPFTPREHGRGLVFTGGPQGTPVPPIASVLYLHVSSSIVRV